MQQCSTRSSAFTLLHSTERAHVRRCAREFRLTAASSYHSYRLVLHAARTFVSSRSCDPPFGIAPKNTACGFIRETSAVFVLHMKRRDGRRENNIRSQRDLLRATASRKSCRPIRGQVAVCFIPARHVLAERIRRDRYRELIILSNRSRYYLNGGGRQSSVAGNCTNRW